jgi:adenine-specific DNA-methyltransferase
MKKTDLVHKLKQLQGISDDERAYLINLVNTKKKYGLVWEDKPEDVEEQLRENLPVLKEVKDRAIINGEEYPNHILIEGDNLHALTALTFTHEGKIDVIYIDPPYNRGDNDFIYNDDYIDKEDSFRHSKWLSFMSKRLEIAKRLLSNDGVIFISIDDNEFAQLKMLCDEIFLERNFIECFQWEKTQSPSNLSKKSKKRLEYILCYEKSRSNLRYSGLVQDNPNDNPLLKSNNNYKTLIFPKDAVESKIQGNHILEPGEYGTTKNKVFLKNQVQIIDGKFINDIELEGKFVWTQDNLNEEIKKKTKIVFKSTSLAPRYDKLSYDAEVPPNIIDERWGVATNDVAKSELEGFEIYDFEYPKPVSLIKYLISFYPSKEITVLDFFAGTGTTLESTIELNSDGGNRQCILVCNNEKKGDETNYIPEKITYKRASKVINGYTKPNSEVIPAKANNNLRYFKSEFVSREPSIKNKKEITRLATELLCIKEDIYAEQKQVGDYQLNATYVRCFQHDSLYLLVIYDEDVIEQMVEVIQSVVEADMSRNTHFKVYVFSNGQYPYTEEFDEVLPYVTLCAIPDAIYKAYQNVLPKRQRQQVPDLEEPTAEEVETSLQDDSNPNLFNQAQ